METSQSIGQRPRLLLQGGARTFRPSPFERIVLVALLAVTAFGGYTVYARSTDLNSVPPPAPTYLPAFRNTLTSTVTATGTVQSSQQVTLTFGSTGKIQSFFVKLGDKVVAGQELAKIDDTELLQTLKSADSALASAQARYAAAVQGASTTDIATSQQAVINAQNGVTSAQNGVVAAQKALDDLLAKPLPTEIATAQQGILQAQNGVQSSVDALAKAQTDVVKAQTEIVTAQSDLAKARDALDFARREFAKAETNCDTKPFLVVPSLPSSGSTSPASTVTLSAFAECTEAATPELNAPLLSTLRSAVNGYNSAAGEYNGANTALTAANTALTTAQTAAANPNLMRNIENANIGVAAAQQKLAEAQAGAKPADVEAARRGIESAQASVTASEASLASAQSRYNDLFKAPTADVTLPLLNAIDQARANVETAKKNLAGATIVAPFDGQISQLTGEVGSQVSATTTVFILLNPQLIRIDANVDQADISNIKAGQTANLTFDALPGRSYQAQVAAVGLTPTITQGVVTYVVTLSVDTTRLPANTPIPAPGMTGSIGVTTSQTQNALVVPSRAVRRSGRTQTVTVKTAGGDEVRTVQTGVTNGTLVQIVNGLQDGDEVLVNAPTTTTTTTAPTGGGQQQFFGGPGGGVPIR